MTLRAHRVATTVYTDVSAYKSNPDGSRGQAEIGGCVRVEDKCVPVSGCPRCACVCACVYPLVLSRARTHGSGWVCGWTEPRIVRPHPVFDHYERTHASSNKPMAVGSLTSPPPPSYHHLPIHPPTGLDACRCRCPQDLQGQRRELPGRGARHCGGQAEGRPPPHGHPLHWGVPGAARGGLLGAVRCWRGRWGGRRCRGWGRCCTAHVLRQLKYVCV